MYDPTCDTRRCTSADSNLSPYHIRLDLLPVCHRVSKYHIETNQNRTTECTPQENLHRPATTRREARQILMAFLHGFPHGFLTPRKPSHRRWWRGHDTLCLCHGKLRHAVVRRSAEFLFTVQVHIQRRNCPTAARTFTGECPALNNGSGYGVGPRR